MEDIEFLLKFVLSNLCFPVFPYSDFLVYENSVQEADGIIHGFYFSNPPDY